MQSHRSLACHKWCWQTVGEVGMCGREKERGGPSSAERPYLAGRDLLQGILAFGKARVLHDDHDDGHLLVDQRQGPVLQLPSQDAF